MTESPPREYRHLDADEIVARVHQVGAEVRRLGVRRLTLFGSFAGGSAGPESDVDFLVEFEPGRGLFNDYVGLLRLLEEATGRDVDLVKHELVRNELKPYIFGGPRVEAHF